MPCNTHVYFIWRENGALDMTVCCRSNDAIWGCYGANAVHFSILHEYIAARLGGVRIGRYYHVSNDLHAYTDVYPIEKLKAMAYEQSMFYPEQRLPLLRLGETMSAWHDDLFEFMDTPRRQFRTSFFNDLVIPMYLTWNAWKRKNEEAAHSFCSEIAADDWRMAAQLWIDGARK